MAASFRTAILLVLTPVWKRVGRDFPRQFAQECGVGTGERSERRRTISMTNDEIRMGLSRLRSSFGLRHSFVIRHS
ncbi:MAG TPA: hypothetical protein VFI31_02420, partial [Pirellulales bacterium]|nr:hypothetical protein [Pirellulales bacterium]